MIYEADEDNDSDDGIWEDHVEVLCAFLAVSTQWRLVCPGDGTIRRAGLDYTAVRVGLEEAGIVMTPAMWLDLRMIELGAIEASQPEVPTWH